MLFEYLFGRLHAPAIHIFNFGAHRAPVPIPITPLDSELGGTQMTFLIPNIIISYQILLLYN